MKRIRPILKWAGNKYNSLDKLLPFFNKADRLIEPFTGSGAIFMNTNYASNILAEANFDLINLFNCVKENSLDFIKYCETFFTTTNNTQSVYYEFRERFNETRDTNLRAALFLYLNKHGYNGLCIYNHSGIYNVPFGRNKSPYFPKIELDFFYQKSQSATFIHTDFIDTFKHVKTNDLIYCDPPYSPLPNQSSNFSSYTKVGFGIDDHVTLTNLAIEAANKNAKVIISNHDTEFTRNQYKDAKIISFSTKRQINCNTKNRNHVQELIAIFN